MVLAAERMRHTDAFLWYMEDDPLLRSTILAITLLEGTPDWEYLRARMDRASRALPMFRQRVQPPPWRLGPPWRTPAPDFDLDYHLRRIQAPHPADWRGVLDFAQISLMAAFDRDRPLWEFTLIEGLDGGRSAFVTKLHHCLADGIAGVQIAALVVDADASMPASEPLGPLPPVDPRKAGDLLAASVADNAEQAARLAARAAQGAVPATLHALRHPRTAATDAWATGTSVARMVQPVTDTLSPILTARSMGRRFETVEVPMADVCRATASLDCTVNDVFLAALTGGLRRYHERHGATVTDLRMGLPLNLRHEGEFGGNHVAIVRFPVPVGDPDPARRIEETRRTVHAWRNTPAHRVTEGIAFALNLAPRGAIGAMLKHVDFLASNVPGFDVPVFVAGSRVLAYYPFGPAFGAAVNATLMSYAGTCYIGLDADTAALPDSDVFAACVQEGFDEVFAAGAPVVKIPAQKTPRPKRQGSPR